MSITPQIISTENGPALAVGNRLVVNATPHILNIAVEDIVVDLPPSGLVARVEENPDADWSDSAIRLGDAYGIPYHDMPDDICYVVSRPVAFHRAAQGWDDPHVLILGKLLRDAEGNITGAEGFLRVLPPQ